MHCAVDGAGESLALFAAADVGEVVGWDSPGPERA